MKDIVYLDYAAATPLDENVAAAMKPFLTTEFYNPSALYAPSRAAKKSLNSARENIAKLLGAKPQEIIFTSGATEANNLAVFGAVENYPGSHVITTALEHDSVAKPIKKLQQNGYKITVLKPKGDGIVDASQVAQVITPQTSLISVILASNEIGTIQPLAEIAQSVQETVLERKNSSNDLPLRLHTDAAQATNFLDIRPSRLGVDLMSLSSAKIYGPKQAGLLYVKSGVELSPQILGGNQEFGRRSGTENLAQIAGFAKALETAAELRNGEAARLSKLQKKLIKEIQANFECALINGSLKKRLPNILNVEFSGHPSDRLLYQLDRFGICVSSGSACSAASDQASPVLLSLGLTALSANSSIRFSMGRGTTEEQIDFTVDCLRKILKS